MTYGHERVHVFAYICKKKRWEDLQKLMRAETDSRRAGEMENRGDKGAKTAEHTSRDNHGSY